MIDNLRPQSDDESFFEEAESELSASHQQEDSSHYFLGMTPLQRFVIAIMLLLMTLILSTFCLLVTERIVPSFLF